MQYDPLSEPDPQQWLALDEAAQIAMVERYHRSRRIRLPNATLHAIIHTVVESQVALGDELPVASTLRRLISEGLDRHEALHAIGAALASHMARLQGGNLSSDADVNELYFAELRALTKQSWLDHWK